jgi:hypothetical protein
MLSPAAIPPPSVLRKTVVITPAQFLNMDNTVANSVELIAAPGSNNVIVILLAVMNMQFKSAAYTTGTGSLELFYNKIGTGIVGTGNTLISSAQLKTAQSTIQIATPASNSPILGQTVANVKGNALIAALSAATKYLAGDSPIQIDLIYFISPIA